MKATTGTTQRVARKGLVAALSITVVLSMAPASFGADSAEAIAKRTGANLPALKFVGDYEGVFNTRNGKKIPLVAQVVALGKGRFCARIFSEFDKRIGTSATLIGTMDERVVMLVFGLEGDWPVFERALKGAFFEPIDIPPQVSMLGHKVRAPWPVDTLLVGICATETLGDALSLRPCLRAHESAITRNGDWVGPNWLRVARGKSQDAAGVLAREQEIRTLAERNG